MKKTVIVALISMALGAFLFASCCQQKTPVGEQLPRTKEDFSYEENQLRKLAVSLGASQRIVERMGLSELVSEVRSRIMNADSPRVPGDTAIGTDVLEGFTIVLAGYEDELTKIKKNDAFIKSLRGKRILVLPDVPEDSSRR